MCVPTNVGVWLQTGCWPLTYSEVGILLGVGDIAHCAANLQPMLQQVGNDMACNVASGATH